MKRMMTILALIALCQGAALAEMIMHSNYQSRYPDYQSIYGNASGYYPQQTMNSHYTPSYTSNYNPYNWAEPRLYMDVSGGKVRNCIESSTTTQCY